MLALDKQVKAFINPSSVLLLLNHILQTLYSGRQECRNPDDWVKLSLHI